MSSLHAALPNTAAPRSVAPVSNLGNAMHQWVPPQLSMVPPVAAPSFGSSVPTGMYMGQHQPPNMTSARPQGFVNSGDEGPAFGSLNPAAAIPNPSLGGNPFG